MDNHIADVVHDLDSDVVALQDSLYHVLKKLQETSDRCERLEREVYKMQKLLGIQGK